METEDLYTEEPWECGGRNRPHVNVVMLPDMPVYHQDVIVTSPYQLFSVIRENEEVADHSRRWDARHEVLRYGVCPTNHPLPYFYPSHFHYDSARAIYPEQTVFFALLVHTGKDVGHGDEYVPDRGRAERWRDRLMDDFPRKVRLAYVAPSHDAVYLLIQSRFWNGGRTGRECMEFLQREYQFTIRMILNRYKHQGEVPDIRIQYTTWAYLYHDEEVCYRGYIPTREEEQEELKKAINQFIMHNA